MNRLKQITDFITRHQFLLAILLTIFIAGFMTVVSLSLYASSGTLQLDLSRPGYEAARKELIRPEGDTGFSANGPIDKESLDAYQKLFDAQRKELDSISKYKDKGLDDDSLTLSAEVAPN